MTAQRTLLIVCANGRERDDARRLGLMGAGFDRVEYVVLATAVEAVRGLRIDQWAITAAARASLDERPGAASRIEHTLWSRTAIG